jgi:NADH dehydrogenase
MLEKDNVCSGRYKGVKDLLGFVRDWRMAISIFH